MAEPPNVHASPARAEMRASSSKRVLVVETNDAPMIAVDESVTTALPNTPLETNSSEQLSAPAASWPPAESIAARGRREQRTQAGEAIGVHQPQRHQFAQRGFEFRIQQANVGTQFIEEHGAMLRERVEDKLRTR